MDDSSATVKSFELLNVVVEVVLGALVVVENRVAGAGEVDSLVVIPVDASDVLAEADAESPLVGTEALERVTDEYCS